jgi:hypothetical protein
MGNSNRFNDYLRNPPSADLLATNEYVRGTHDDVENLAAVVRRSTLPEDVTVYRTTVLPDAVKVGDVIRDPGFLSTSLDREFIEQFRRTHYSQATQVIEIPVPAGTPILAANNTYEREMLLLPDTPLLVEAIDGDNVRVSLV